MLYSYFLSASALAAMSLGTQYLIKAELPGVKKDDVKVNGPR
jgi:HSP20 family molecular chaperone IbpA